jgi:lipopolysaccharide transport protein LptA
MVYIASQHKLIMTVNAKLLQPDHQVSSQKITYDTQNKIVIAGDKSEKPSAGGKIDEKQRVNITLTPKK